MSRLRKVGSEVLALFVDDAGLALAILAWLALSWLLLPRLAAGWAAMILFAGLVAILLESATRHGRAAARR